MQKGDCQSAASLLCFVKARASSKALPKLAGGLLGFAGIIVINLDGLAWRPGTGDLLILAASFCLACSMLLSKNAYDDQAPCTSPPGPSFLAACF